jgi:hypothetical protein
MRTMTDETGILQHAIYTIPDRRYGYCTDDNARALVVAMQHWELTEDESVLPLARTYLGFLHHAFDPERRRFRNFMDYERKWRPEAHEREYDDVLGRVLWGLGVTVAAAPDEGLLALSSRLFGGALEAMETIQSPRPCAFALVGIHAYLRRFSGDSFVRRMRETLARRLLARFQQNASQDWPWCEDTVTYANGKIPHALILSGQWLPDPEMTAQGIRSLEWLITRQTDPKGRLTLIGNNGWMARAGQRAQFDQQPIDATALLDACAEAYRCTLDPQWLRRVDLCLDWFLGRNVTESVLYDAATGGCRDGLHASGFNMNEGAESTLAWLISLLTVNRLRRESATGIPEYAPVAASNV